jgi:transposase
MSDSGHKKATKPPKPYPIDLSDGEWLLVAPYLTLRREDSPQRDYLLR